MQQVHVNVLRGHDLREKHPNELSSLRNIVRLIHCLTGEENLAEKVRVVINKQGSDAVEEGISLKKAEEVIGKPIFWQVPNDPKTVIGARVAGAPLIKHAPRSRAQQSIHGLAQALYNKNTITIGEYLSASC